MRVLLHACCGPCLLEPYDVLSADAEVAVCYANPNIAPAAEYERRRDTLLAYAAGEGIEVIEVPYAPERWAAAVAGTEGDRAARCRACYELRIGMVAVEAASRGYDAVATTLAVSPYQDPDAIRTAGEAVCATAGVRFIAADFRDRYPDATRRSRELGMYRQNYCGCLPSQAEAAAEREQRRAARMAARAAAQSEASRGSGGEA
ncbi:MAG: epoxyqueuosine reductase QueH [Coriobacteriia bacterium]|nr:epoxyqueuosine reductase QueH [Coriobacteriia bacterium]